tara:strand:- start:46887 stop:47177 length:291 start_codon:yes stop_codon:yes gene_type:complete
MKTLHFDVKAIIAVQRIDFSIRKTGKIHFDRFSKCRPILVSGEDEFWPFLLRLKDRSFVNAKIAFLAGVSNDVSLFQSLSPCLFQFALSEQPAGRV